MKSVKWVKCNGEAHTASVDYDHCFVCMPWWGEYPICPDCGHGFHNRTGNDKVLCKHCRKFYNIRRS